MWYYAKKGKWWSYCKHNSGLMRQRILRLTQKYTMLIKNVYLRKISLTKPFSARQDLRWVIARLLTTKYRNKCITPVIIFCQCISIWSSLSNRLISWWNPITWYISCKMIGRELQSAPMKIDWCLPFCVLPISELQLNRIWNGKSVNENIHYFHQLHIRRHNDVITTLIQCFDVVSTSIQRRFLVTCWIGS